MVGQRCIACRTPLLAPPPCSPRLQIETAPIWCCGESIGSLGNPINRVEGILSGWNMGRPAIDLRLPAAYCYELGTLDTDGRLERCGGLPSP